MQWQRYRVGLCLQRINKLGTFQQPISAYVHKHVDINFNNF